jgi:pilus assembly protein CpaB
MFLGVLAVYLARDWVQGQIDSAKQVESKQVNLTTIVVAKRPLYFGDELTGSELEEVAWPIANVPPGSFTNVKDVVGTGERRVVLKTIQLNEPVLKSKISGFGGRATLSTVIDETLRAVTIRVNDVNGVAGFVLPGDRVDILLTRSPKDMKEQITDVLMQNIKVLGIDQDASEDKDKPKVVRAVTLEVTTEQSQKLTLAQMVGQLALALRGATNTTPIAHRRIRERDLVDDRLIEDKAVSADVKRTEPAKPVKKVVRTTRRDPRASVRVYRGLKVNTVEVPGESAARRRVGSTPTSAPRRLAPRNPITQTEPTAPVKQKPEDAPISSAPAPNTPGATQTQERSGPKPLVPSAREPMANRHAPRPLVMERAAASR